MIPTEYNWQLKAIQLLSRQYVFFNHVFSSVQDYHIQNKIMSGIDQENEENEICMWGIMVD